MRNRRRTWMTTCTALLGMFLIAAVSVAGAQDQATVGDLLIKIADARKTEARTAADASASLRASGFAVPSRGLDDPLTEGLMVEIAGAFGVNVTTSSPGTLIDARQVDSFMAAFSTELSGKVDEGNTGDALGVDSPGGSNGNGANPLEKGKGKKKGIRTPTDPA